MKIACINVIVDACTCLVLVCLGLLKAEGFSSILSIDATRCRESVTANAKQKARQ